MDDAVNSLLTTGAMMLGLVAFIGTFLIRRIVETAVPTARKLSDPNEPGVTYATPFARWWNEVVLYALPAIVGGGCGTTNIDLIFGDLDVKTMSGRVVFGVVVGFFSGFVYKVARKLLKKTTGVDLAPERGGSMSVPPTPAPPAEPPTPTAPPN